MEEQGGGGGGGRLRLAPSLAANLLARVGRECGARTMCYAAPGRHPAPPAGRTGCAGAPSVRVSVAGGCPAGARQESQSCRRALSGDAEARMGRVDLPAAKTFIMGWTPGALEEP